MTRLNVAFANRCQDWGSLRRYPRFTDCPRCPLEILHHDPPHLKFLPGRVTMAELPGEMTTATRTLGPLPIRRPDRQQGFEHAQDRKTCELYLVAQALALLDP